MSVFVNEILKLQNRYIRVNTFQKLFLSKRFSDAVAESEINEKRILLRIRFSFISYEF